MSYRFDYERCRRIGLPESVFCEGKDAAILKDLVSELIERKHPVLLTRLSPEKFTALPDRLRRRMDYDRISRTAFVNGSHPERTRKSVAIVTAGTSDVPVATEALRTLVFLGVKAHFIPDVGVAGLWRLEENIGKINACDAVIAVAGMDAALVSVLGGLTSRPLIGVPTSVGYGVAADGISALHSMMLSCSPGIVVTNIDNGYGAACAAFRMLCGVSH